VPQSMEKEKVTEIIEMTAMVTNLVSQALLPLKEQIDDYRRRRSEKDQITTFTMALRAIQFYDQATALLREIKQVQSSDTISQQDFEILEQKSRELMQAINSVSNLQKSKKALTLTVYGCIIIVVRAIIKKEGKICY